MIYDHRDSNPEATRCTTGPKSKILNQTLNPSVSQPRCTSGVLPRLCGLAVREHLITLWWG